MGIVTEKATGNKFEAYYFVKNGLAPLSLKIWNNPEEIDQAIMADKKLRRLSEAELEVARKAMSLGIEYRNHPKAGCKTYMLDQSLLECIFALPIRNGLLLLLWLRRKCWLRIRQIWIKVHLKDMKFSFLRRKRHRRMR